MPVAKIFSAEKRLTGNLGSKKDPNIKDVYESIADIKSDIKSLATIFSSGTNLSPERMALLSEAEKILVDKTEFERHKKEIDLLKTELNQISDAIEKTKAEIASLAPALQQKDKSLDNVTLELDAITDSTEKAAEEILEMTENIETVANSLKLENQNSYVSQQAEDILQFTTAIFEACNFQDLTGQRISKAIKTLNFVGERIDKMISIWGKEALVGAVNVPPIGTKVDSGVILSGPSLEGQGISQDDIDKLFD